VPAVSALASSGETTGRTSQPRDVITRGERAPRQPAG
jgi:hypothetical protein